MGRRRCPSDVSSSLRTIHKHKNKHTVTTSINHLKILARYSFATDDLPERFSLPWIASL
jgi:hypothetical protein